MFRMLNTVKILTLALSVALSVALADALAGRRRDERGEAVPWLIVIGAGIAIAYFAGDSVMAFARNTVSGLGK
jgi:hypothetical protein